ncbi:MAG: DUF2911 domain-containing protein [Microscillaceae bacterium]|jgi:hypothetical protein|nr:DUF2911 domain-containing protein [Microscillaceae bacterium]
MKRLLNYSLSLFLATILSVQIAQAQLNMPQPSPSCKIVQKVGLGDVTISYSRPGAKGRVIFGDLVPFGKVWRTGANSPTKIKFEADVIVEGNKVAAGEYSLFTIPDKTEWTIILNKDPKNANAPGYQESDDVAKFKVKTNATHQSVESFTINFTDLNYASANVEISWEKTSVKFRVEQEVDSKIKEQITRQLDPNRDAGLYYQVASYYFETNQKNEEALSLITKSVDMAPRFWTVHLKAKIQARMNDKSGAIASAEKSKQLAIENKNDDYVKLNDKLIAELKKK